MVEMAENHTNRVLSLLAGSIVHCQINNVDLSFFVMDPQDPIQNHHLRGCFFEEDELQIIAKHVRPGATIADIGANIGNHALFFEKILKARSVILFELNPDAINILNINKDLNHCSAWDDQFLGFALSDKIGRVSKFVSDPHNLGATQFNEAEDGEYRSISGDSVLAMKKIDFIKIDVEGAELKVLKGLTWTVLRWRPPIFVELRQHLFPEFGDWLKAVNYEIIDKYERYAGLPNYLIKSV